MKKINPWLILSTTCLFLFFSCKNEINEGINTKDIALKSEVRDQVKDENIGKVPTSLPVFDIILVPDQHTWKDLDRWYREELPEYKGTDYYNNLESMLFYHLIEEFKLDEKADLQTVEYYIRRQLEFGLLMNPDGYVKCLQRMEKEGNTRYLLGYSVNKYNKDMELLSENPAMEVLRPKYEGLKNYVAHMEDVFHVVK